MRPAPPLWPREPAARAAARQLEMKSDEVYFPHVVRLMGLQERPDDPAAVAARDAAARYYLEMEARLADREWLAGDYTFADIAFYMAALFGERMGAVLGAGNTEAAGVARAHDLASISHAGCCHDGRLSVEPKATGAGMACCGREIAQKPAMPTREFRRDQLWAAGAIIAPAPCLDSWCATRR